MPQIDKGTFGSIILWTWICYTLGYLFLNATVIYQFFSSLKLIVKRFVRIYFFGISFQKIKDLFLFFPLFTA